MQVEREIAPPLAPQPMGEAVRLDRVETLEIEQRFDEPAACRVTVEHRLQVDPDRLAERRIFRDEPEEALADQVGGHIGMVEAFGDAVRHGLFETLLVEHAGMQERCQSGLVHGGLPGVGQNRGPDRIDGVQRGFAARMSKGHGVLLRARMGCNVARLAAVLKGGVITSPFSVLAGRGATGNRGRHV